MDPVTLGLIGVAVFVVLLFIGMRIAYAGFVAGALGLILLLGWLPTVEVVTAQCFTESIKFEMTVIPLFVLMGYFGFYAAVGDELFDACQSWVGNFSGGLSMATVGSCAMFGAITGSSPATAALFSKLAYPQMKKHNYSTGLAVGSVAAGGTLATLIPPSTNMVIYGSLTEQSIGKILVAGVLPGIMSAIIFSIGIYLWTKVDKSAGPKGDKTTFKHKMQTLRPLWGVLITFVVVIGGLYVGFFTPTEGGAVGALAILLIAVIRRKMSFNGVMKSLLDSARISCMIFFVIIGIKIFSVLLVASGVTAIFVNWTLNMTPAMLLLAVTIIYLIFGCFIGVLGMLVTTLPFIFPAIIAAGYDPIWFGIYVVILCEIAMLTPPVGINCYVTSNVTGVPLEKVFKSIVPFLIMDIVILGIIIIFPQIVMFLPNRM